MRAHGFSMIELMIAIAIATLMFLLAGPMYGEFLANSKIRNAGESMLNGVRLAQTQALRSNLPTEFQYIAGTGWSVTTADPDDPKIPLFKEDYALTDGAINVKLSEQPGGATTVTFGGLGRIEANADASASLEALDIVSTNVSSARPLRVIVSDTTKGFGTKLCDPDPALKASDPTNPQLCP